MHGLDPLVYLTANREACNESHISKYPQNFQNIYLVDSDANRSTKQSRYKINVI